MMYAQDGANKEDGCYYNGERNMQMLYFVMDHEFVNLQPILTRGTHC